jgi:hypothetical protein
MLADDVHVYTSPKNHRKVYGTIVYPIKPAHPVPLLIRQNGPIAWAGGLMAGSEFRGYARAWVGHPFHSRIFADGSGSHEKTIGYGKSAIRALRKRAKEFNVDPGRFGVHGASKHGNQSVWLGVTGDVRELDTKWGGLHQDISSSVQFVAAEATWGFSEHLVEDKAPADVPAWMGWQGKTPPSREWLLSRSWTSFITPNDPPMAIDRCHSGYWRTEQIRRLIRAVGKAEISFIQSLDSGLPNYRKDRKTAWLDFADSILKPECPKPKASLPTSAGGSIR